MNCRIAVCLLGLSCVWGTPAAITSAQGAELQAGVAVEEITPPAGYRMSGYFRERLNTGVKDPLFAKAIVFRQDDQQAALVFCDLIGLPLSVSSAARKAAAEESGIPVSNIAISATHSHTGPLYFGALRQYFHDKAVAATGSDPYEKTDYERDLVRHIVSVISRAQAAAAPVQLAAGYAREERLAFNRRFHMKTGPVRFNPGQLNPDIVRVAGPIDPEVGLISLTAVGSTVPHAALVSFALHLDTVGGTEYSADYPKYLQDSLQKSFGPEFVSLFGTGTCGDINHVDVTVTGRRSAPEIGTMLAESVAPVIPKLKDVTQPTLAVRSAIVNVPMQSYTEKQIADAREKMDLVGTRQLSFLDQVEAYKIMAVTLRGGETVPLEVQVFRISRDVAIVTLPGEVFVDLGIEIKQASPFATTLVIELTNDVPGYIPTRKAFVEGSYETVNSRIQPGGAEKMVDAAIRLLRELEE